MMKNNSFTRNNINKWDIYTTFKLQKSFPTARGHSFIVTCKNLFLTWFGISIIQLADDIPANHFKSINEKIMNRMIENILVCERPTLIYKWNSELLEICLIWGLGEGEWEYKITEFLVTLSSPKVGNNTASIRKISQQELSQSLRLGNKHYKDDMSGMTYTFNIYSHSIEYHKNETTGRGKKKEEDNGWDCNYCQLSLICVTNLPIKSYSNSNTYSTIYPEKINKPHAAVEHYWHLKTQQ